MTKFIFLIYFGILCSVFSFAQTSDSIFLDSTLTNPEISFTDSINALNEQNQLLSNSRNAYNTGLEFMNNDHLEEAIIQFTNAITIDSAFSAAYISRAKCYEGLNNALAIADYRTVFSLDSTNLQPFYSVAALQLKSDKVIAKQTYQTIISLNKTEYKAYSQLGVISFLAKDYQEAEQLFAQSLTINTNAYTLNDRGSCYRKLEQFDAS